MSEYGFIAIARSLLDHPIVGARKPYSDTEAWLWLLFEAAWKPKRVRVTNGRTSSLVVLERGELSHSRSFMAAAWGWSEKRVRTFLNRLETDKMIDRQTGQLQTKLKICNYNNYQTPEQSKGQQTTPQTGQQRAVNGPEEEQLNKETKERTLRGASAPAGEVTEKQVYDLGKSLLGKSAGGMITELRKFYEYDLLAVKSILDQASEKSSPREWIAGVLRHTEQPKTPHHILFPPEIYRGLQ